MKICSRCLLEKDLSEYNIRRASKDGLQPHCRECDKLRIRSHDYPCYEERTCVHCKETHKLEDGFPRELRGRKGYRLDCFKCAAVRSKKYRKNNPETWDRTNRNNHLKYKYGITIEDFELMLLKQDYKCAICKEEHPKRNHGWQVDHDHATGQVRGILCHFCNITVGHIEQGWNVKIPVITKYLEESNAFYNCQRR